MSSIEVNSDFFLNPNVTRAIIDNSSSSNEGEMRPFVSSVTTQIIWSLLFGSMVLTAIIGNSAVIVIILVHKRMRTKTNLFLLNLSIADFMMATFNAMFNFLFMLNSHWAFGSFYCTVNNFLSNVTVFASIFTIMATSFDRYMAVVHPLKPRMSKNKCIFIIGFVWLMSSTLALPSLLFSKTYTFTYASDEIRTVCILHWPDGVPGVSYFDYLYNILFFVLAYAVPMSAMGYTYSIMIYVLSKEQIGEMTSIQQQAARQKQKVVRLLFALFAIFGICWLPYHLYFLYTYHQIEINQYALTQHLYLGFYWLAMFNSALNPIIYCLLNARFRSHFKNIFCCTSVEIRRTNSSQTYTTRMSINRNSCPKRACTEV